MFKKIGECDCILLFFKHFKMLTAAGVKAATGMYIPYERRYVF